MKALAAVLVAAGLALGAGSARGQNLLPNGSFSLLARLDGWTFAETVSEDWSGLSRTGEGPPVYSGSAQITHLSAVGAYVGGSSEVLPITPGQAYDLAASLYIPPTVAGFTEARAEVAWCPDGICSVAVDWSLVGDTQDTAYWIDFETTVVAPATASHFQFWIRLQRLAAGPDPIANFDALYVPEPALGSLQAAATLVLTLMARRSRRGPPGS